MKKIVLKMVMAVMVITALTECKKEETSQSSIVNNGMPEIEANVSEKDGQLRQTPYELLLASLATQYGCCYDFSDIYTVVPSSGVPTVNILIVPSTWFSDYFLTIFINGSAQVIGMYDIQFVSGFDSKDEETNSYEYWIYEPNGPNYICTGFIYTNIPGYQDYFQIFNSYHIPGDYPYAFFDNLSGGYFDLEGYYESEGVGRITPKKMAAKMAASLYIHIYLEDE